MVQQNLCGPERVPSLIFKDKLLWTIRNQFPLVTMLCKMLCLAKICILNLVEEDLLKSGVQQYGV